MFAVALAFALGQQVKDFPAGLPEILCRALCVPLRGSLLNLLKVLRSD